MIIGCDFDCVVKQGWYRGSDIIPRWREVINQSHLRVPKKGTRENKEAEAAKRNVRNEKKSKRNLYFW